MPPPIVSRLNPAAGWPGGYDSSGVYHQGTFVIIEGNYFHPTPEMDRNRVYFPNASGGQIQAPVEWASFDEIHYQSGGVIVRESTTPGGVTTPRGVAVDSNENLFIADTGNHRIIRRSAAGAFTAWGSNGAGNGQFNRPTGIAVDPDGNVYVADTMNNRIQKFTNTGSFITAWGSSGSGQGQFDGPVAIDIGDIGGMRLVYVADSNNKRVVRTGTDGSNPTQLLTPAGTGRVLGVCAPKGYGFVYASDPANHRIFKWAWNGPFNGAYGADSPHTNVVIDVSFPMGLAQDSDGFVYVADNADRVIKKYDPFDPNFREIARFGLSPVTIPAPTPEDEFVDPVDIAVTDLKATYIVDRNRNQVVRYTPLDSQEIWVHVPQGAVSGSVEVQTDEGSAVAGFMVYVTAQMAVHDYFISQGLVEYPFVAGKKSIIRYEFLTTGATSLGNYYWGNPATDTATCVIRKDGTDMATLHGIAIFKTMTGGFMSAESGFEIQFEIPYYHINDPGDYDFAVTIRRTGTHAFQELRTFSRTIRNRKRYSIVSSPVTHLTADGNQVSDTDMWPALFYVGSDVRHLVDWMDWQQLYHGFMTYNRLYPLRFGFGDISEYGIWPNGTMHDGINSDDEVREMLLVLETTRRRLNEDSSADYDFMIGVVSRSQIHDTWAGITSDSYRSLITSIGVDDFGDPAMDVGEIIGHELLHQHGCHHHGTEYITSSHDAWNSVSGEFVSQPVSCSFAADSAGGISTATRNDFNAFVELNGEGGENYYDTLFDALSNPHPKHYLKNEIKYNTTDTIRPSGTTGNFTLIGLAEKDGTFYRRMSWIGSGNTLVTPPEENGNATVQFLDENNNILLSWGIALTYGLRATGKTGHVQSRPEGPAVVSITVPFPQQTYKIELRDEKKTIWEEAIPIKSPSVLFTEPQEGAILDQKTGMDVRWKAVSPEDRELLYTLEYSFDEGKSFRPVAAGLNTNMFHLPPNAISAHGCVQLKIIASDGFNTAADTVKEITVGEAVPRISIVMPKDGEIIPEGTPIKLMAMASDIEKGILDLSYSGTRWILDNDIVFAHGNDIYASEIDLKTSRGTFPSPLSLGTHILKVEHTYEVGKTISHEICIQITTDSDRDGIPDSNEGTRAAPVYPFGHFRFLMWRTRTIYQISHLLAGDVRLEMIFIDEHGQRLKNHNAFIQTNGIKHLKKTNGDGILEIELHSLQTVLVTVPPQNTRKKCFGVCYIRIGKKSILQKTTILASCWIHRKNGFWIFGKESKGTVLINEGNALEMTGSNNFSNVVSRIDLPDITHRVLGRLINASNRLSKMIENRKDVR